MHRLILIFLFSLIICACSKPEEPGQTESCIITCLEQSIIPVFRCLNKAQLDTIIMSEYESNGLFNQLKKHYTFFNGNDDTMSKYVYMSKGQDYIFLLPGVDTFRISNITYKQTTGIGWVHPKAGCFGHCFDVATLILDGDTTYPQGGQYNSTLVLMH